jgi:hypothetical protein
MTWQECGAEMTWYLRKGRTYLRRNVFFGEPSNVGGGVLRTGRGSPVSVADRRGCSLGYAQGQEPGKIDLEASELAVEIIGAPVSDPSGKKLGRSPIFPSTKMGNPTGCA